MIKFKLPTSIPFWLLLCFSYTSYSQDNNSNFSLYLKTNDSAKEQQHVTKGNLTLNALTNDEIVLNEDVVNYELIAPMYENHLEKSSIIYGLAKVANISNVNGKCYKQLKNIRRGILRKEPWAVKVLDASGTKPPGFVFGQNFWFGSREACSAVQRPVDITLSSNFQRFMNQGLIKDIAPFDMDYRVIYLKHHSSWQVEIKFMPEQVIHIGLCLPTSCDAEEIQDLMTGYIKGGRFVENDIYDIQPEVLYMKDLKMSSEFFERTSFKLLSCYVAFILAMTLIASYLRNKNLKQLDENVKDTPQSESGYLDVISTKLQNVVMCFDLQANSSKMFSTKDSQVTEIPVINGLRSICAAWIMLFHVMWYMYFTVHNKTFLIAYSEKLIFQHITSAPLLVDVFFTISGFLQTYNFLKNSQKLETIRNNSLLKNTKQFFKLIFHRCLRLVPLYLVVIAVVDLLFFYMGKVSVYDINEKFDEHCGNYWWRNFFFIHNLFDHKEMCVNWSWSLACEMQYFIIATFLLFIYTKRPQLIKTVAVALVFANIGWTYFIGFDTKLQMSFDSFFATGTHIYISPFVRIMPYVMGAIAAWCLVEHKSRFTGLTEVHEKRFWDLSIFIFFICLYATLKRDVSSMAAISMLVGGRLLFTTAISWIIIGSATGRSTWWSRFLEAKPFQHFNRISYAFFLLNPMVISFFFGLTSNSTHTDPLFLCVLCTGFAVIVYLVSLAFSLAFEMPLCNWSTLLLKRQTLKAKNS